MWLFYLIDCYDYHLEFWEWFYSNEKSLSFANSIFSIKTINDLLDCGMEFCFITMKVPSIHFERNKIFGVCSEWFLLVLCLVVFSLDKNKSTLSHSLMEMRG